MKTTKLFRTLAFTAVIMTIGCAGLAAQPKAKKEAASIEKTLKNQAPKENKDLRTITGEIGTFSKYGRKFITITSTSKRTYIVDIDELGRDSFENLPGNEGVFTEDNAVSAKYLLDHVGSRVTLTGSLDKETGVFAVIKSGTVPRPQTETPSDVKDAK